MMTQLDEKAECNLDKFEKVIDQKQNAYRPFFTDDFASRAFAEAADVGCIKKTVMGIVADWRAASYAAALPASIPLVYGP